MSRPQIGIDRLPARRMSNEPRESMNCKSCRKRKIKCNRLRPTCEACQVFACPCIYDAVPKKRGPKTDVLEALLKRVDGLEKRLHGEKKSDSPDKETAVQQTPSQQPAPPPQETPKESSRKESVAQRPLLNIAPHPNHASAIISPTDQSQPTPAVVPDLFVDTYFARIHGKPYHILDELSTRQRLQTNQLPSYLAYAIYAVSSKYVANYGGYNSAARMGQEYARRSRMELDVDEPSIEALQTLLLLALAAFQAGKGKRTHMMLSMAISMAFALDLHRELPLALKVSPAEREGRRRLFWACYLLDRFTACGSKRPSLISDECIVLRVPSWQMHHGGMLVEGDFFPNGSNLQYMGAAGKHSQGSTGMLIGIVRILGITNRYLAAGGVKGDSHFPWHSLSNLSKIRQDLNIWASETQDTFASLESLFGQPDSTILVLSKLIYHLIHCLIYRPFLPVDLAELSGTGQHQSWQIEATHLCFCHANAIAELVEIGRASSILDWPAFVGYCVCTAGTIHVHGAHYRGRDGEVYSASAELLSREMHQLNELRVIWSGVQHQRETLQTIYGCHSELVKSLASNPMRFSPVFQLEDFFDRYPGQIFDGAHVTLTDVSVDTIHEGYLTPDFGSSKRKLELTEDNSLATYNLDHRNNLYMGPNMNVMPNMPQQVFLPSQQPNVHTVMPAPGPLAFQAPVNDSRKKRRATDAGIPTQPLAEIEPQTRNGSLQDQSDASMASGSASNGDPSSSVDGLQLQQQADAAAPMTPFTPNMAPFSPSNFHFTPLASQTPQPSQSQAPPQQDASQQQPQPQQPTDQQPLLNTNALQNNYDSLFGLPPYDQKTPGAASASGSAHTDPDKDPFLSLLEQLAENEGRGVGPSELDLFLSGTQ